MKKLCLSLLLITEGGIAGGMSGGGFLFNSQTSYSTSLDSSIVDSSDFNVNDLIYLGSFVDVDGTQYEIYQVPETKEILFIAVTEQ